MNNKQLNGKRKEEHLRINLEEDVRFEGVSTGLENYRFIHQALPELDADAIDLSVDLFGKRLRAPLIISSMVGGIEAAREINRNLGRAAQALGIAMGVGSQRAAIEDGSREDTYRVRDVAPDILLFANLGAVQLNYGYGVRECRQAVDMIGADGLILHLNPLQEVLQHEGNTDFAGLADKIKRVCHELPFPVIVKEVGWGISHDVARKLALAGVSGIDVAGAGGTSWSEVEKRRAGNRITRNIADTFSAWGISTAESILAARRAAPDLPIIASGGVRTGLDVAMSIALGADGAGIASPLVKAAHVSADAVQEALEEIIMGLRISMFCTGSGSIKDLKVSRCLLNETRNCT